MPVSLSTTRSQSKGVSLTQWGEVECFVRARVQNCGDGALCRVISGERHSHPWRLTGRSTLIQVVLFFAHAEPILASCFWLLPKKKGKYGVSLFDVRTFCSERVTAVTDFVVVECARQCQGLDLCSVASSIWLFSCTHPLISSF